MTNQDLIKQLRTASVQCDEMRLRDFGYLMKSAADALEQLEKESRKWELDAHANKLERDNYLKKSQEFAAAWCDALDKVRVWIPVTERLPEDSKQKIVFHSRGVSFAYYSRTGWFSSIGKSHYLQTVTHWMPLPNPPAKGREE